MGSTGWNGRYADGYSAWSATPGIWVQQLTQDLPPGTARDVRAAIATTPRTWPIASDNRWRAADLV
jgi:hypothetical protein